MLCNLCGHLLATSPASPSSDPPPVPPTYRPSRLHQLLYRQHFRLAVLGLSLSMVSATGLLLGWFFIVNPPGTEVGAGLMGGGLILGAWGAWFLRQYW